jgi:hypothetical protein
VTDFEEMEGEMAFLVESLPRFRSLQDFGLGDSELTSEKMVRLAPVLPKSLKQLSLRDNPIRDEGVRALAGNLPPRLEVLGLNSTEMTDAGAVSLAPRLPSTLRNFNLQYNRIGDEGVKAIAKHLPQSLLELLLGNNAVGWEGLQALLPALPKSLLALDLAGTREVDVVVTEFATNLTRLTSLRVLHLTRCYISTKGIATIVQSLPVSIEYLMLSGAPAPMGTEAPMEALLTSIPRLTALNTFVYINQGMDSKSIVAIMKCLPRNVINVRVTGATPVAEEDEGRLVSFMTRDRFPKMEKLYIQVSLLTRISLYAALPGIIIV